MGREIGPVLGSLSKLLSDEHIIVRIAAADALLQVGHDPAAIGVLQNALLDDDIVTRIYAAIMLLDMKDRASIDTVFINESMQNPARNIPDRYYNIYLKDALQRLKDGD
jgi:HEAT repeat protein